MEGCGKRCLEEPVAEAFEGASYNALWILRPSYFIASEAFQATVFSSLKEIAYSTLDLSTHHT